MEIKKDDDISNLTSNFKRLMEVAEKKIKECEENQKKWNEVEKMMKENQDKAQQIIKFNVGGRKFETSKSTLLLIPNTYFYALLSSGNFQPDSKGYYFIDRNGSNFECILDFLRTGKLRTSDLSQEQLLILEEDLDYFLISDKIDPELIPKVNTEPSKLKWDSAFCGNKIQLHSNDMSAKMTGGARSTWQSVIGTVSVNRFKLKIMNGKSGVIIGFVEKPFFKPLEPIFNTKHAWSLYTNGGLLYPGHADYLRSVIADGSIVETIYDEVKQKIRFIINGKEYGDVFNGVPAGVYPFIAMVYVNSELMIIE